MKGFIATGSQGEDALSTAATASLAAAMLQAVANIVLLVDGEGRLIQSNQSVDAAIEMAPQFWTLYSEEVEQGSICERFKRITSESGIGGFECWSSRESGSRRLISWLCRPVLLESGPRYFVLTGSDVTEEREALMAAQKPLRRHELAMKGAIYGTWDVDLATGEALFSPGWKQILGYEESEIGDRLDDWKNLIHPEDRSILDDHLQKHLEANNPTFEAEIRTRHKTEGWRWISVRGVAIRDESGTPIRLIGSHYDIHERKLAEQRIWDQKHFLRKVIDTDPNFIFVKDAESRFVLVNKTIADAFGMTPDQLIGKKDSDIDSDPAEADHFEKTDRDLLNSDSSGICIEEKITCADGSVRWLETVKRIIISPETGERQILGISTDITNRIRYQEELVAAREQALAASRLKSEFLANMSHEIRTPMNGVLGLTELLLATSLDDDQGDLAKSILRSAESLLTIINDILDYSKIEAGKMTLEPSLVDMVELVEDVCESFRHPIDKRGLVLCFQAPWSESAFFFADPTRLRQILTNLIGNAVKFTEFGGVTVTLEEREGPALRLSVTDTGIGISPESQEHVFESFTQADGSTTRRYGGTGLGLTIVRRLMELMNGSVELQSELGKGSTFSVTFPWAPLERIDFAAAPAERGNVKVLYCPVVAVPALEGALHALGCDIEATKHEKRADHEHCAVLEVGSSQTDSVQFEVGPIFTNRAIRSAFHRVTGFSKADIRRTLTAGSPQRKGRVLLAEDNEVNRKVAFRVLAQFGLQIDTASNGAQALSMAMAVPYDLILMDVQMPDMDGLDATRRIREIEKTLGRRTTILAMTAHAMQGDRERCLAAGMDDYMSKPIRREELEQKLDLWIPSKGDEESVLDKTYLSEMSGNDSEFECEIVSTYLDSAPALMNEIKESLRRDDRDGLHHSAHTLKGSSRSIGAQRVANVAERIEIAARQGDLATAALSLPTLISAYDELVVACRTLLKAA